MPGFTPSKNWERIMRITRRFLFNPVWLILFCIPLCALAQSQDQIPRDLPRPNPNLFQTGDFVWPKKPGAYVPYNSGSRNSPSQDKDQWLRERDTYLKKNSNQAITEKTVQQRLQTLRAMDYREFIAVYAGGQELGVPGVYSGGSVYVGHVGIIEIDTNKTAWVIEALIGKGVTRVTYDDWLRQRSDEVVWLGRLRDLNQNERAKIIVEAKRHLQKPYDFWNFDLNDDSAFYCSKLAWLSIYRSLKFPVDGKENSKRTLWFSPKQFLYLPTIERIHDPGPYAQH